MRTIDIAKESGTKASIYVIVNGFYAFGRLDRQLVEFLDAEGVPILAKVPRAVALSQAAGEGRSVADYAPLSHVVPSLEDLTDAVEHEKDKKEEK